MASSFVFSQRSHPSFTPVFNTLFGGQIKAPRSENQHGTSRGTSTTKGVYYNHFANHKRAKANPRGGRILFNQSLSDYLLNYGPFYAKRKAYVIRHLSFPRVKALSRIGSKFPWWKKETRVKSRGLWNVASKKISRKFSCAHSECKHCRIEGCISNLEKSRWLIKAAFNSIFQITNLYFQPHFQHELGDWTPTLMPGRAT